MECRRIGAGPPIGPIVDSLVEGFEIDPGDDLLTQAIQLEIAAGELVAAVFAEAGPGSSAMVRAIAEDLASRSTTATATDRILAALAQVTRGPMGMEGGLTPFLRTWSQRRRSVADPIALSIGEDRVVGAVEVSHVMGDGSNVFLVIDHPLGPFTVAVYIDFNLGGMAKDLMVGPPIEEVDATFVPDQGFRRREIDLSEAAWRFGEALDLTNHTLDAPISEDFEHVLPFVATRFPLVDPKEPTSLVDPDGNPFGYAEITRAERVAHLGAFRSSPEFAALADACADDAAAVVDLWIDHAVGYTVGKVRRVSPVLVELFCASWFPRKVMADDAMVAAAPAAIEAWLRFCARTTGLEDRWIDEALDALGQFGPELRRAVDDPAGDPELQALLAEIAAQQPGATTTGWERPDTSTWEPLEITETGERIHLEADPSAVPPWQYAKTRAIASQASVQAASLLGPSFTQPAMQLAVDLGTCDPCPYDNTQIRSWPGAIVWILAEDNDAFSRKVGRRRDDLAGALPMTRATYQTKAKKIRETLILEKGDLRITW